MKPGRVVVLVALIPVGFAVLLVLARPKPHAIAETPTAPAPASPAEHIPSASGTTTTDVPKTASEKAAPKGPAFPFQPGEELDYRVSWTTFSSAATIRLSAIERRNLYGWDAWHFRAVANTQQPVRSIFTIDDQFDSYVDAATFGSHQYEMYLDEMGKQQKSMMELTPQGQVPRSPLASVIVAPGTRDPIALLQSMRAFDWDHNAEMRVPVFDGHKLYEIRATREAASEKITVPAGTYTATRISVGIFSEGKEVQQTRFEVWLAHDAAKMPVVAQAEIPFGTFRVELTSVHLGKSQ
jgi:uncharacterized protein DUF3108